MPDRRSYKLFLSQSHRTAQGNSKSRRSNPLKNLCLTGLFLLPPKNNLLSGLIQASPGPSRSLQPQHSTPLTVPLLPPRKNGNSGLA